MRTIDSWAPCATAWWPHESDRSPDARNCGDHRGSRARPGWRGGGPYRDRGAPLRSLSGRTGPGPPAPTLHLAQVHRRNPHHIVEAAFKGSGLSLHRATRVIGEDIPSTKGVLG